MDVVWISLVMYFRVSSEQKESIRHRSYSTVFLILGILDCIWNLVAIHGEMILRIAASEGNPWTFVRGFWYYVHIFCNCLHYAAVLEIIIRTGFVYWKEFRRKFIHLYALMGAIPVLTGIHIFLDRGVFNNRVDASVLIHGLLALMLYLNDNVLNDKKIVSISRQLILEETGHPVLLFDREQRLMFCNGDGRKLLEENMHGSEYTLDRFLAETMANLDIEDRMENTNFVWHVGKEKVYRCDFRQLNDEKGKWIGYLFVLTDNTLDVDINTGFDRKETMHRHFANRENMPAYPVAVIACDINQLAKINSEYGIETGDRVIRFLGDTMRNQCPKDTYFARMDDAVLIAVCPETDLIEGRKISDKLQMNIRNTELIRGKMAIQTAICMVLSPDDDIYRAARTACNALRSKKMLDANSAHASLLASLARAQTEGDPDTGTHVQRTREMGDLLGRRLGLSDTELNDLSLLCLLHDIGKLGIPLEILNKPGQLTRDEWEVMKSHVDKGFRIARVSDELADISDLILHHHECWDGSGYPDGLKGNTIPLLSRIISVVDSYDAMTNDRVYRKALPRYVANAELKRCSGTQFDPNIVSVFLQMLHDLYGEEEQVSLKQPLTMPAGLTMPKQARVINPYASVMSVVYAKYVLDKDNRIIASNDEFSALTGYTAEEVGKNTIRQETLIFEDERDDFFSLLNEQIRIHTMAFVEYRMRRKDGSALDVLCTFRRYYDPVVRDMRIDGVVCDIRQTYVHLQIGNDDRETRQQSMKRLGDIVRTDLQTGLLSRDAF